jgi:hypothetical protein
MKAITLFILMSLTIFQVQAQKKINGEFADAIMYINKDYKKQSGFQKVLVQSGIHDPKIDKKILDEFRKIGILAVSGMELTPPIKEYTADDIKKICEENRIDGVVTIERQGYETSMLYNTKTKVNLTLTIQDMVQNLPVATFIGYSMKTGDRGNFRFAQLAIKELEALLKK